MEIPTIQQLIDAGVEFTEVTRERADAFVKQLVDKGEVQRRDAERIVQELVDRGRETSERITANVQREVAKQVEIMSARFDELEKRFEALTEALAERVPSASALVVVRKTSARKAPAKKAPAKKAAAPAKKAPAKKRAAKKAPAKKRAAKKSTAKKASGAAGS
jgi:polyhydroxyalkanoate synthesis regulator phasin